MTAGTKQQQLTFDKGITNVPSDIICSDNALEESLGMVYDEGEHRIIQNPALYATGVEDKDGLVLKVLYVHKFDDKERFIAINANGEVKWGTVSNGVFSVSQTMTDGGLVGDVVLPTTYTDHVLLQASGTPLLSSIGKTLVIADNNGLHYFIWKNATYKDLGQQIPVPKVEFYLVGQGAVKESEVCLSLELNDDVINIAGGISDEGRANAETYRDLVIGLYEKCKNQSAKDNYFSQPFFVRYALELFNGDYMYVSQPILLFPTVNRNLIAYLFSGRLYVELSPSVLKYEADFDYSDYADIVKNVVVFASRGVEVFDKEDESVRPKYGQGIKIDDADVVSFNGIIGSETIIVNKGVKYKGSKYKYYKFPGGGGYTSGNYVPFLNRESENIDEDITTTSVFYKIAELGITSSDWAQKVPIKEHVIENLTTQEQLPEDDYFSRSSLIPKTIFEYNSRLNIANVSRSVFEGYSYFMPLERTPVGINEDRKTHNYGFYVTVRTDSGDVVVRHIPSDCHTVQGYYFYYPDARAKHVIIFNPDQSGSHITIEGTVVIDEDLKEHTGLNGAYYFSGIQAIIDNNQRATPVLPDKGTTEARPTPADSPTELLPNYVISSGVNNPFLFPASGYFKVGTGKILALSTITQALSQGQYGQFPLIIFSESGLWSASLSSEGLFTSVHPMPREVALMENPCITQTDGAVFFASEKGLMMVVSNDVRCVSPQLSGKSDSPFTDYLKKASIAYDYRDSLLWIFDGSRYSYVYSLKTGTFARYDFSGHIITWAVNNYPDYLLQSGSTLFSLLSRANINHDSAHYSALLTTRPLKLENGLALKSIMQLKNIYAFYPSDLEPTIQLTLYASNNLRDWVELKSLRGTPWKYYRFRYLFTNLKATDRFAGTVLLTQERRTNKLR